MDKAAFALTETEIAQVRSARGSAVNNTDLPPRVKAALVAIHLSAISGTAGQLYADFALAPAVAQYSGEKGAANVARILTKSGLVVNTNGGRGSKATWKVKLTRQLLKLAKETGSDNNDKSHSPAPSQVIKDGLTSSSAGNGSAVDVDKALAFLNAYRDGLEAGDALVRYQAIADGLSPEGRLLASVLANRLFGDCHGKPEVMAAVLVELAKRVNETEASAE